ncbi:hypothetical protein GQ53DRAFT_829301 [Thozetella sp. PMI_491]|nr:hypothetical protein GQ53DRAFT_829301 [Thozetella sp. PMI_491]
MSDFLDALAAHDPSRLSFTSGVKYVENYQFLPLGLGLWAVASSPGKYRHVFADPEAGQVGAITTIKENDTRVIYIVRLKIDTDGRISEIESRITRDATGAARYETMGRPEDVWSQVVAPKERISRENLIANTNKYYTGMERNDPNGDYTFFDKNCSRIEDGLQTVNVKDGAAYGHSNDTTFASLTCEEQFQTGFLGFVTLIRERRFPIVDEERQAMLTFTTLDHNGTVRSLPSANGTASPIPPYFDVPRTLAAVEGFRLRGEKLYRIEMTLTEVPYGQREAFPVDPPQRFQVADTDQVLASPCDRVCLESLVDEVLKAMVAHDHSTLPLAEYVRYSENGQFLAIGNGLWLTLASFATPGKGKYAARFAEPAKGTAGYWGETHEYGTPGVLALRIKTDGEKITEIEAISVRAESRGARGGTVTLMRPPLPIEWEGGLRAIDQALQPNMTKASARGISSSLVAKFFDGLERHSSAGIPFSPGCFRRDNGFRGNYSCAAQMDGQGPNPNGLFNSTTNVRDRRILLKDTSRGVVMAVVLVDNPATSRTLPPPTESAPSTYLVPQLLKVKNGTITRVHSFIKWVPFGYVSAWAEAGHK